MIFNKGEKNMSIEAGDFRTGLTLLIDGNIYQVLDFMHVKPGKGAAILKTKLRNLRTGSILERNFNTTTKFEQAIIEKKEVQFSYVDGDTYNFMDSETYEMYEIDKSVIGFAKNFLVEGNTVIIKFFESEVLGLDLPSTVTLTVTETTGAVAGNTASTATKDAKVETGLVVKVPLFIKEGDKIIIFTDDGKYNGRA